MFLDRSPIIDEAKKAKFSPSWPLQLLLFFAVTMVGQMLMSIPAGMYSAFYALREMLSIDEEAMASLDIYEFTFEMLNKLMNVPVYLLISLLSTALMILTVIVYARLIEKRSFKSLGIVKRGAVPQYFIGFAVGFAMFSAVMLICYLTGAAKFEGLNATSSIFLVILFFIGYLIQGAEEELLMRGFLMTGLGTKLPIYAAVIINSVVFSLMHLGNSGISLLAVANLILFGLFASLYFLRTESLFGVCAIHSVWNFLQGNFFGCSVSGMGITDSIFTTSMNENMAILNGGKFGPEGGIAVSVVLVLAIVLVLVIPQKKVRHTQTANESADDSSDN